MEHEVTTNEIMEFLKDHMVMKADLDGKIDGLRQDLRATELRMLDAVDLKLVNLKSDMLAIIKKEDVKLGAVVSTLKDKDVFTESDTRRVLSLEPFPQASV